MDTAVIPLPTPAEAAIAASGLAVTDAELPRLARLVERRLPADAAAVRDALVGLRRRGWAAQLEALAREAGRLWVTRDDARRAADRVSEPEPGEAGLLAALDQVLHRRLRDAGDTAKATVLAVLAELEEAGTTLDPERTEELARSAAAAHGLDAGATDKLAAAALLGARERQAERREVEALARAAKREELRRLRAWEASLVPFARVAELLGCTQREALRWIGANMLPVARRTATEKGNHKGGETWEFDPAQLLPLRAEVPAWRDADAERERERKRGQAKGDGLAAPAVHAGTRAGNAAVARVAALDRYAAHFATARSLNRRITLVTGPTNSGKSHLALDRLAGAQSGMALAPLRLLAHEFRDALGARGVAAALSTGEERIPAPGSRHLAATVEMCPQNNPVDVAIIDEAQMLYDPDRGAAWTAAIMGAPAREVFVLGAPECIPSVRRIAALCDDPVEEISLQRKGPLVAARERVALGDLKRGDALIAFSRREVLDFRAELVKRGRRVAVVYGALSPEVRKAEAARFNDGDADILVATDAIGMGLNLGIARVVLGALRKFDGQQSRDLTAQEVKQIGGRAGRHGRHEAGVVAVLVGAGAPEFVAGRLAAATELPADLRPLVQPDAAIIRAVADEIGSESLFGVLARIRRAVLRRDDPNYRLADMSQAVAVAAALEGLPGLGLGERWVYAMCPIDQRDNGIARLARWAMEHGAARPVPPPAGGRLPAPERASREELEKAEKLHKRLVAWRWLALRFPETYVERAQAEAETVRLDQWIEGVLRQQRRGRAG